MDDNSKKIEIKVTTSSKEVKSINLPEEESTLSTYDQINDYLGQYSQVTIEEKLIFYRLFATMINAWVSLIESLNVLTDQAKSPKFKKILKVIKTRISGWSTIANSMKLYPDVFDQSEIWVIKAWEESWKLKEILMKLASQIEKTALIEWKVKWAMIYPFVIILVVMGAMYAIMTLVIPQIKEMFTSMWAELPPATKMLISLSDFLGTSWIFWINNWILIIGGALFFYLLFSIWKRTDMWAYYTSYGLLYFPLFGMISQKISVAKFCWAISLLTWSWIDLIESLQLTANMIWNQAYKIRILRIVQDVQQWLSVAQNMKSDALYFPPMVSSMIYVWEKTGQISEVSLKVSEFLDDEVDSLIKNLMQLIEPLIIVVVWIMVAWIVIAVMVPLLSMSDIVSM